MSHNKIPSRPLAESAAPLKNKLFGMAEHEQRLKLHYELHGGSNESIEVPMQVSHIVLLCENDHAEHERSFIAQLCDRYGVTPPTLQSNQFTAMLGTYRINWERHTEYS